MIYLKTYCYAPHELEFIMANFTECHKHIDKMIVCEFDINHTGTKRDFRFSEDGDLQTLSQFSNASGDYGFDKLDYHSCEVFDETARAYDREDLIHSINEPIMRSYFTKLYDFKDDDIIISVDADEIIYGDSIGYILNQVEKYKTVALKLRQFFYKKTYLWKDKAFTSPIATYYSEINPKFPNNWRDVGQVTHNFVGCHFSWCMTPDEMIHKLYTYSHPQYRACADKELLTDAIKNKKYPFDPSVKFDIEEIDPNDKKIPKSMRVSPQNEDLSNVVISSLVPVKKIK